MTPFPIGLHNPARFTAPVPPRADVVVIGGGIAGVMTAWFLNRAGLRVVLCEKGRIAGEQSSRNWGWVRKQGRDPDEIPLVAEAQRIWAGLAAEVGQDLGYRQTGVLYLANTPKDIAPHEAWMVHARAHGLDTRLLTKEEVAAMVPGAADWAGGLWTASDGRAEPWIAVPAIAGALAARGAAVIEDCAVRALDRQGGRVAGVVTERGRIAADHVVLAGGAWSGLFARAEGVHLPQLAVRASVCATEPLPQVFAGAAADAEFAFRRREDGGYTLAPCDFHEFMIGPDAFRHLAIYRPGLRTPISGTRFLPGAPSGFPDAWSTPRRWSPDAVSPFERTRVLNPAPFTPRVERLRDQFARAFPKLGRPRLRTAWAGMIDTMPDVVPVIDHAQGAPGLTIVTGLSGHGFGIGPAVGRVAANLVMGRAPGHEIGRFRHARFTDGSRIVPGPAL
ncbi:NAD(P)/FAD-dependent oxidoreductase [Albidovulum sediminicola]|uniref:FAD-binding oxidoreductase n=1 Tax=Albidovulum sediminicola TaxID=2984331 RepID=A0ABT2YXZ5_9RHOB|nr:FAD-binding oxidoreductase [Defluviimonas sp. WL0075]MCV2863680.1 FAD-binding oxidoreductase [Defluviimonas sp. WL0075]